MHTTITLSSFIDAFRTMDRMTGWSHEGLEALFDFMEETDVELDVVALCCDWSEYDSVSDACDDYASKGQFDDVEPEDLAGAQTDWLNDQTVCLFCENDHVVVCAF